MAEKEDIIVIDEIKKEHSLICPKCTSATSKFYSDCFSDKKEKLCELWFCMSCKSFFPSQVSIPSRRSQNRAAGSENRKFVRFDTWFVVEAKFDEEDFEEPLIATVINASDGGVFFPFPREVKVGEEGQFRISLPSVAKSFNATGKVVRCIDNPGGGFGIAVRFTDVDDDYNDALTRYVGEDIKQS
ncbi:MAG: PilZ domain-containing protein [Candidatus Lindowbacteria bacterium]|nr:PilZ domain-containing protein [Candidatus Lindowbacteria bacterium]